jgi:hypothetical protein
MYLLDDLFTSHDDGKQLRLVFVVAGNFWWEGIAPSADLGAG